MSSERVTDERLARIADEYSNMASKLTGELRDGPGAASAFYMSCSLGEIAGMAHELQSLRSGGEEKNGVGVTSEKRTGDQNEQ